MITKFRRELFSLNTKLYTINKADKKKFFFFRTIQSYIFNKEEVQQQERKKPAGASVNEAC